MSTNELDPSNEQVDQAENTGLTLDLTQAQPAGAADAKSVSLSIPPPGTLKLGPVQPGTELTKFTYNQPKQWDFVRMMVTLGLLAMFGWVIVWACIESSSWPNHWAQTKEMLNLILPAITGLIGSVIGFYFGSNTNSSGASSSGNTGGGTAPGNGK
jgi:hypothetical protein